MEMLEPILDLYFCEDGVEIIFPILPTKHS